METESVSSTVDSNYDKEVAKAETLDVRAEAKALEVRAKSEARAKAKARGRRFQALAKAEALAGAEARIEASKAKAARFASFLKAEREKNKSDPKFTQDANLVIKPSNLYVESKVTSLLQEDSTPATKLGVNSKEVESVGVMPIKVEVKGVELCSRKDSTPALDSGVMPSKMADISVELCSKRGSITALREDSISVSKLGDNSKEVDICSEGDSISPSAEVMPIKTDSEKMVSPSNNEYRIIFFPRVIWI